MFRFHKCPFFSLTPPPPLLPPQYLKPSDDPVWNCAVRVRVFIKVIIVPLFFETIAVIGSGLCKIRVWTFLMSFIFLSVRFPFFSLIWYDRGAIWHIMVPLIECPFHRPMVLYSNDLVVAECFWCDAVVCLVKVLLLGLKFFLKITLRFVETCKVIYW